jgi:hypothetical protein
MKFSRSIFCVAVAALTVLALMSGAVAVDHAFAVAGLGGASLAMAGLVTIKAPVTVHYKGKYVVPGTEIEVSKEEADRLTEAHGAWGGPGEPDPANTQMRNVDIASIKALNEQAGIHKGHGRAAGSSAPSESDLEAMKKDDLLDLAAKRGVDLDAGATKADIIAKLKA